MQPEVLKYLFDIQTSILSIREFVGSNQTFNDFDQNKLLKRGVERELEIIGEAVNRILKIYPHFEISNARKIVNLRNWVIHSYDNVDAIIIWVILTRDLPILEKEVHQLVEKYR